MQGISNHTYQDLIQDLSFIIMKTEDKCKFHVIRVGASTIQNTNRCLNNQNYNIFFMANNISIVIIIPLKISVIFWEIWFQNLKLSFSPF